MTNKRILFFCRGRGRGHAVPDLEVVRELSTLRAGLAIQLASYGTGAETIRQAGYPVADLGLPEANPFLETLIVATRLIAAFEPDVVVSHEEFAALPAARTAQVPAIFITDWFPPAPGVRADCLAYADSVVFTEERGVYVPPPFLGRAPCYVEPVVRKMRYTLADRSRARSELAVAESVFLLSVIPGSWATEARVPLLELVLSAWSLLRRDGDALVWVSSRDHDLVAQRCAGMPGVCAIEDARPVERLMVASDVVLTKGNRGTIMELTSLGVPSLSLSPASNPIDDVLVSRIRSNTALGLKAVDGPYLAERLQEIRAGRASLTFDRLGLHERGGEQAARALLSEVDRLSP